jgi:hypothetical protein
MESRQEEEKTKEITSIYALACPSVKAVDSSGMLCLQHLNLIIFLKQPFYWTELANSAFK